MSDVPPAVEERQAAFKAMPGLAATVTILSPFLLISAGVACWAGHTPDWMFQQLFGAGLLAWQRRGAE